MRPESPTPFPIPEILNDSVTPPTLTAFEVHPPAFADLMMGISKNRQAHLRRITVYGGLGVQQSESISIYPIKPNIPQNLDTLFAKINSSMMLGGFYHHSEQYVAIFPDTILLLQIGLAASNQAKYSSDNLSTEELVRAIKDGTIQYLTETIIEELEHNYQRSIQLFTSASISVPDLWNFIIVEPLARIRRRDPEHNALARKAFSPQFLISDQQLLDFYDVARDRYRAFKGESLKESILNQDA